MIKVNLLTRRICLKAGWGECRWVGVVRAVAADRRPRCHPYYHLHPSPPPLPAPSADWRPLPPVRGTVAQARGWQPSRSPRTRECAPPRRARQSRGRRYSSWRRREWKGGRAARSWRPGGFAACAQTRGPAAGPSGETSAWPCPWVCQTRPPCPHPHWEGGSHGLADSRRCPGSCGAPWLGGAAGRAAGDPEWGGGGPLEGCGFRTCNILLPLRGISRTFLASRHGARGSPAPTGAPHSSF